MEHDNLRGDWACRENGPQLVERHEIRLAESVDLGAIWKIGEIDRQDMPPLLKLRLMENEENLFYSGLYVGMMGTAAALVLQVLGVIEPNLLAAYSSNLFGIVCVAFVKIRHVRGYKRRLILAAQSAPSPVGKSAPVAL